MKTSRLIAFAALCGLLGGCGTVGDQFAKVQAEIQTLLNSKSRSWVGNAHLEEHTPWLSFSVNLSNIHFDKDLNRWVWDGFDAGHTSNFSNGAFSDGPVKAP